MYAIVNHLHLTKRVGSLPPLIEQGLKPTLLSLPGFIAAHFVKVADV
jgi:hypothetical protein